MIKDKKISLKVNELQEPACSFTKNTTMLNQHGFICLSCEIQNLCPYCIDNCHKKCSIAYMKKFEFQCSCNRQLKGCGDSMKILQTMIHDTKLVAFQKICSFRQTQATLILQHKFECLSCQLIGICPLCVKLCHKEHKVVYHGNQKYVCICSIRME